MTATLKKLLPLHDLRERRALRQFQEDGVAHELAMADQIRVKSVVLNLREESKHAFESALAPDISAMQALAGFEYSSVLASQAAVAGQNLDALVETCNQALEKLRLSRLAYIHQVRVNQTLRQASQRQLHSQELLKSGSQEQRAEDEFVPVWLAQQRPATGVSV
jgi:hypothetical protein